MFTQWADIIFRKFITFVDISADFTYKSFLTFCFRFRFYIFLIIGVAHCLLVTYHAGFCHTADEHSVSAEIHIVFYLQGHESIDITYRYAHLFPTRQAEMADKLDMERKGA